MAMTISDECICCGVCEQECPNGAISMGDEHYCVDPETCTECVGHYDSSQCTEVCPVEAISRNENPLESRETLQARFNAMIAGGRWPKNPVLAVSPEPVAVID